MKVRIAERAFRDILSHIILFIIFQLVRLFSSLIYLLIRRQPLIQNILHVIPTPGIYPYQKVSLLRDQGGRHDNEDAAT